MTLTLIIRKTQAQTTGNSTVQAAPPSLDSVTYNGRDRIVAEKNKEVADSYLTLMDRVLKDSKVKGATIFLSEDDFDVIVNYMIVLAKNMSTVNPFIAGIHNSAALFMEQFRTFDTFIYEFGLANRSFYIEGLNGFDDFKPGVYSGGNINYIGVGALASSYGLGKTELSGMVRAWNRYQYYSGEGKHNLKQSAQAMPWAFLGHELYKSRESTL